MQIGKKLLSELQRRLKIGNRRGVHLNAIPGKSNYKFDLHRLSSLDKNLPNNFVKALLSELPLKFRISWKENVTDLNDLFEEDQLNLNKIAKSFENLINQTEAIESEKGINTFGFGFPIIARRDKVDNKLTVAPLLIWSLRIKRTKEFNTWEVLRNEDDPIYINEVLINHIHNDCGILLEQISSEMLDDGLISKEELIDICSSFVSAFNKTDSANLKKELGTRITAISNVRTKEYYEKLNLSFDKPLLEFCGIFSIFEVQKQNIINDYNTFLEASDLEISEEDYVDSSFQSLSSVETDPSQQSILHALETKRNILIQGPPGTGKSQTLTAILINALESRKRVLVVCEKRTALEVLHNALSKEIREGGKGLGDHCVLVKDTIKDRSKVVDSVRSRVDSVDYRGFTPRRNVNQNLDDLQSKAKSLIVEINKKHFKLGKKILGNKIWPDVVGLFLDLSKEISAEDYLKFEKKFFGFSLSEFNELQALVDTGQVLFVDYQSITAKQFLEPSKLVGTNPYSIEDNLNTDFSHYSKQLTEISDHLQTVFNEYKLHRTEQINLQTDRILFLKEKLISRKLENDKLVLELKNDYRTFRESELKDNLQEKLKFLQSISEIVKRNNGNSAFFDTTHISKLSFRFLANFSKRKKKTLLDSKELEAHVAAFSVGFSLCFEQMDFFISENRVDYLSTLPSKHRLIASVNESLSTRIDEEFNALQIEEYLEGTNSTYLGKIETLRTSLNVSQEFIIKLQELSNSINKAKSEAGETIEELETYWLSSRDYASKSFVKATLGKAIESVDIATKRCFDEFEDRISIEFRALDLLQFKQTASRTPLEDKLREQILALSNRVISDGWSITPLNYNSPDEFINCVKDLIAEKDNYFRDDGNNFLKEYKWNSFYIPLSDSHKKIIDSLKTKKDWRKTFLVSYLNQLLLTEATVELPTNDTDHEKLTVACGDLEKEQLKFIKSIWKNKQFEESNRFEQQNHGLSVGNLYLKKKGSRNTKLSLRQIIKKDPELFSAFFPIVLTSPDVASNLFQGNKDYFDIVMFDEASQLRLEDNLPAILKGKQIVIAGDEHQMPPSNYFSKVFDGTADDEDDLEEDFDANLPKLTKDDVLLECESLLDFGQEMSFHKKHLDFHYRSKHPYLIDFSNHAFYKRRLKPLPNNFDYVPIKYIQVAGTFSEHTNEVEAEMVLSIIENNINRLPDGNYPTVGIATFNITQRNLIKSKIEDRKRFDKYKIFNQKIQELGLDDPTSTKGFIKNLENIQGDERDIIILSTTYGIGKDGNFKQRFGPINHTKGYKLLNVIITRAKYKVYCCTSIPESIFLSYKDYLATEGGNNRRAAFYAYLAYCKSVSESNFELRNSVLTALTENETMIPISDIDSDGELESPFEEEVYQRLAQEVGTEKLIPQLQFAGFRIDIVYDPKIAGKPKIAIECDGAKYHSSREAYLHDRHRQKILESHGFVFHRIWSTSWWRNPKTELRRLIEFIEKIENSNKRTIKNYDDYVIAFSDKTLDLNDLLKQKSNSLPSAALKMDIKEPISTNVSRQSNLFSEEVKPNCKVILKYLNNNKSIKVQIVTKNEIFDDSKLEFKRIYQRSPLAEAILGHCTGDIVKIGGVDNFVEIIQVLNN